MEYNKIKTTICDSNNRIDSNLDEDLVQYGVVYANVLNKYY